jgi:hypothetical protein
MKLFHICRPSPWGKPVSTEYSRSLAQYRACTICGSVSVRLIESSRDLSPGHAQQAYLDAAGCVPVIKMPDPHWKDVLASLGKKEGSDVTPN